MDLLDKNNKETDKQLGQCCQVRKMKLLESGCL